MRLHVLQTSIQVVQRFREIITTHKMPSSWRIETTRNRLEIVVILQVFVDAFR